MSKQSRLNRKFDRIKRLEESGELPIPHEIPAGARIVVRTYEGVDPADQRMKLGELTFQFNIGTAFKSGAFRADENVFKT